MTYYHNSVLLKECIEKLNIKNDGIYLDCTLGGAGHSSEILKEIENGLLIGIDRDSDALKYSMDKLKGIGRNFVLAKSNFKDFNYLLDELQIDKIDGAIIDLGVSSYQLDSAERGFSYRFEADLDMRMDKSQKLDASFIVNNYTQNKLEDIFYKNAEERWAKRIAKFIVENRPIKSTSELVRIIKAAIPKAKRENKHPAKKVFQAIRIEVNNELNILEETIINIVNRLSVGGRLLVISFHSIEDRIIKNTFKNLSKSCICPKEFPICTCNKTSKVKIITNKPIYPSYKEMQFNSRSRSAKLRIAQRI